MVTRRLLDRSIAVRPILAVVSIFLIPTFFGASCVDEIDTSRPVRASSLGDDLYGLVCDRLGASVLSEDLTGASYHSICHCDAHGNYGALVDTSLLHQSTDPVAQRVLRLSIAKLQRLAQLRPQLIQAFNTAFPDIEIPDRTTADPLDTIRLHEAVLRFSQDVARLYEENPIETEAGADPLIPVATRAWARAFSALEQSPEARAALASIAGRQGYQPSQLAFGSIRLLLSYPELRSFTHAQAHVLAHHAPGQPQLQELLEVMQAELASSAPVASSLEPYQLLDSNSAQPNRPRTGAEVLGALFLAQHDAFASPTETTPHRFVSARDARGVVVPCRHPLRAECCDGAVSPECALFPYPGTVPVPFADTDGDGFADVDRAGRFVDSSGEPLSIDPPFTIPGQASGSVDEYGRPAVPLYQYLDTPRTLLGALVRNLIPLLDSTPYATADDPEPHNSEYEALMYALAGLYVLTDREPAQYDYTADLWRPADEPCDGCLPYQRFKGEQSPLVDFVHGIGQVLTDPESDVILLALIELLENHEQVTARFLGEVFRMVDIANQHDQLAANGEEPRAELAYTNPLWDEVALLVSDASEMQCLLTKIVIALADERFITPSQQEPPITGQRSEHFGQTLATFLKMRDKYQYNQWDPPQGDDYTEYPLNGPAINVTDGYPSYANPHNPVDRSKPLAGDNRSMFELGLSLMHDSIRAHACNKAGARLFTGLPPPVDYWPLTAINSYAECEVLHIDNAGAFFVGAALDADHPKRAEVYIKPQELQTLMTALGLVMSEDELFQTATGITEMTLQPSVGAMGRLLFFGSMSEQWGMMPDYDVVNADTNTAKFVAAAFEAPCGVNTYPPKANGVSPCPALKDTMRMRHYGTIFGWERLNYVNYYVPLFEAFVETACDNNDYPCTIAPTACNKSDYTGENLFGDLMRVLWRHWPGPDHGESCSSTGSPDYGAPDYNPVYCSEAGLNRYEPILADIFSGELVPALQALAEVLENMKIKVARGPRKGQIVTGAMVVEQLVKVLFSQPYAAKVGMADRHGNHSAKWVDGTHQEQLTVYTLMADALHRFDTRFDTACDCDGLGGNEWIQCQNDRDSCQADVAVRRSKWRRARSLLVDQFLSFEGQGAEAHFANPSVPRALSTIFRLVREQLNAHCPDRENGVPCSWAKGTFASGLAKALSGPLYATTADFIEVHAADETTRRQLQRFFSYTLLPAEQGGARPILLAQLADLLQLLVADAELAPLFNAVASLGAPLADTQGPGVIAGTVLLIEAVMGRPADEYDRYHVLDYVLPALVSPIDGSEGPIPLEVFFTAIADIHRADASLDTPLDQEDYRLIFKTVREFLSSETRGLEQLYHIAQNRLQP